MSDNKKYYYLKLKDNFFDSEEMKILESQKNGIEYQNLYLKLCLLSLKSEGKLTFKEYLPYDITMLSTVLRVNIDTVKTGLEIFSKLGLLDIMETGLMFMTDIQSLIGRGSSEAERVKEYRERIKNERSVQTYKKRTPEKEIELEIELEIKKEIDKEKEESFNIFWSIYDKKVNQKECKRIWNKIDSSLYQCIYIHARNYVISKPDKQYRKDPERYLKYEMWTSEIISNETDNKKEKESIYETLERLEGYNETR